MSGTEKKGGLQLAFYSKMAAAKCECHKGQTIVMACILMPNGEEVELETKMYPTEGAAVADSENYLRGIATAVMKESGLPKPDREVVINDDAGARKAVRDWKVERNPEMH